MQLVKGKNYSSWRSVGFSLQAAQIHEHRSVDELIVLNIAATPSRTGPNLPLVKELTAQCFMPITVGGDISTNLYSVTNTNYVRAQVHRGGTGGTAIGNLVEGYTTTGGESIYPAHILFLDKPNTASSVEYLVKAKNSNNANNISATWDSANVYTLQEIMT